jgi:hypothetical protein
MLSELPPLRSAQFTFVGPASGTLRIKPSILRQGKSTVFVNVDLDGDAGLAARALLCFAVNRKSSLDYVRLPPPDSVGLPDTYPSFFKLQRAFNFLDQFDGRFVAGARPGTRGADPEMLVWLRHRDEMVGNDLVSLIALADALPPPAMILHSEWAPMSTMTWSIDVLTDQISSSRGWWLARSSAETAQNGYSAQSMTVWGEGGRPTMAARQTVAVFD